MFHPRHKVRFLNEQGQKEKVIIVTLALAALSILLISFFHSIYYGKSILASDAIAYKSVEIADNSLTLKGVIIDSHSVFSDYDYKIEGEMLLITFYSSNFKTQDHESDKIDITIHENFSDIKKIYQINSKSGNSNMIWPEFED